MKITDKLLSIGHCESSTINECNLFKVKKEIYKEHNHYHVRVFKYVKGSSSCDKIFWGVFTKLAEARKTYKKFNSTNKGLT